MPRWMVTHHKEMDAIDELYYLASDRAVGIVVASIVEIHLTDLIKSALLPNPISYDGESVDRRMFQSSGPLGAFSAKIKLSYLMGLVSEEAYRDLENMRWIRNRFAHYIDVGSFTVQEIADRCMNFKMIDRYVIDHKNNIHGDGTAQFGLEIDNAPLRLADPKDRYVLAAQIFALGLQQFTPEAKPWTPFL